MTELIPLVRSLRTNVHNLLSNTQLPPDKIQEQVLQSTVVTLNKQLFSIKARTSEVEYAVMCDTVTQLIGVTMEFIALKNARQPTGHQKESGKRLLEQFQLNCKEIALLENKRQKQNSVHSAAFSLEQLEAITSEIQQASHQTSMDSKKILDITSEMQNVRGSGFDIPKTPDIDIASLIPYADDKKFLDIASEIQQNLLDEKRRTSQEKVELSLASSSSEYSTESGESSRKNSEDTAELKNHNENAIEPTIVPTTEMPISPTPEPIATAIEEPVPPPEPVQETPNPEKPLETTTPPSETPLDQSNPRAPASWLLQSTKRTTSFSPAKPSESRKVDLKRAETQKEQPAMEKPNEFFPRKNYSKRPSIIEAIPESSLWIKIQLKPEKPKKFFLSKQRKHDAPSSEHHDTTATHQEPTETKSLSDSQTSAATETPTTATPPPEAVKFDEEIFEEARQLLERNDLDNLSNILNRMNINMQDPEDQNNTLLHWSVGYNNLEVTKLLVEKGATLLPNDSGINPLHMAVQLSITNKSYEPVKSFLKTL